jgi:import inner membrane translocase subunit TIM8
MDSLGGGLANVDLTKLSDRDKQELQQFVMNEGQKARIQSCALHVSLVPKNNSSRI